MKTVEEIKHGKRVVDTLVKEMFFVDILKATGLDTKKLQQVLRQLQSNGHVTKTKTGMWHCS